MARRCTLARSCSPDSLALLSTINNQLLTQVPVIGLGICWASMVGVPYLMVASMVPREKTGAYTGILNMMIVVPMLIQTVTFGWIFENLLDNKGTNAILLAGALLGCAAAAMLWVNTPRGDEDSSVMPLAGRREITVYDQVVVGSDGTPSPMYAVARAHEVAAAPKARVVVVSAYDPGREDPQGELVDGRKLLYGEKAAPAAMRKTVQELTSDRIRDIEQVVVAAKPAEALLRVAGQNPASLISWVTAAWALRKARCWDPCLARSSRTHHATLLVIQTSALSDE